MTNPTTYTICDDCPCNSDREYSECKLGFLQRCDIKFEPSKFDEYCNSLDDYPMVSSTCGLTMLSWISSDGVNHIFKPERRLLQ